MIQELFGSQTVLQGRIGLGTYMSDLQILFFYNLNLFVSNVQPTI